jgi:hypothetical protein
VFGRRKQRDSEAAREADRRALFEELAKRPDTVCPFLGLAGARTQYRDGVTDEHRCYAFGDPAELSAEQQQKVCLQRGYGNCPRYLRGVLVIPTEELEALRRPQAMPPPPPPVAPRPTAAAGGRRRGRGGLLAVVLVLLLAVGGGFGAFLLLGEDPGIATPTATPSETPTATESGSVPPSATPEPTPIVLPSSSGDELPALPTPGPDDESTGFAVFVTRGEYPVVRMDADGNIGEDATALFSRVSAAPVQRLEIDGDLYWRTLQGGYTGLAYSRALSDDFYIYETYETADGEARFRRLSEDEL